MKSVLLLFTLALLAEAAVAADLPNLRPHKDSSWSAPLQIKMVNNVPRMTWGVKNDGKATAASSPEFKVRFYLDGRSINEAEVRFKKLVKGQEYEVVDFALPVSLPDGKHALEMVIDGGKRVKESNEKDNSYKITFVVEDSLAWGASVDEPFRNRVRQMAADLEFQADHLMAAMAFETSYTFSPSIRNPNSSAVGLIQFLSASANEVHTTTNELAAMSALEQLEYVQDFLALRIGERGRLENVGDVYMAIHYPVAIHKPDATVLYSSPSPSYKANKALDTNGDLKVTRKEAITPVINALAKGRRPENSE